MQELASAVNSGTTSYNGDNYYGLLFPLGCRSRFQRCEHLYMGIGMEDSRPFGGFQMFCGFFDGNGHVIRNLQMVTSYPYNGLFNVISVATVVKNLTLASSSITGQNNVGGRVRCVPTGGGRDGARFGFGWRTHAVCPYGGNDVWCLCFASHWRRQRQDTENRDSIDP